MKKIINTVAVISLLLLTNFKNIEKVKPVKQKDFVPDEQTAIKVAEAIWLPIFGESINDEKPFKATLIGNVWLVTGAAPPPGTFGGSVTIKIRKSDCKILLVEWAK